MKEHNGRKFDLVDLDERYVVQLFRRQLLGFWEEESSCS